MGIDDSLTLPSILRHQGYETIHCGKAHFGAVGTPASDPRNLGFDVNIGGHAAGAPGSYQGTKNYGNGLRDDREAPNVWGVPGLEEYFGSDTHLTDALVEKACAALADVPKDQPVFLYFAPYAVHTPIEPHGRFMNLYDDNKYAGTETPLPPVEAQYASMVTGVDAALGRLLETLETEGRAENTLIVFTSDNGGLSEHARGTTPLGTGNNTHCWPLREGKGSAYEGGIRVPLLVAWARPDPKNPMQKTIPIATDNRCDVPVICEDIFATLVNWAGANETRLQDIARTAGRPKLHIDGCNWTALLSGGTIDSRSFVFHYPHVWGPRGAGYQPHSSIIAGDWKAIYFYQPKRWELYNLREDIGETSDLARSEPDRLEALAAELIQRLTSLGALFPESRDDGKPEFPQAPSRLETVVPVPSSEDRAAAAGWTSGGTWLDQHADINRIAIGGQIDLVFLGDSITQSWGGEGRNVAATGGEAWAELFADRRAANFGISGDRTQHVLWRIENGNLDGIDPSFVVLMIGTNNLADESAEDIAEGIERIVRGIEERLPLTKIILCGILPRGSPYDLPQVRAREVNARIATLANDRSAWWLDMSSEFLNDDHSLRAELFAADQLHLSAEGYRIWGAAVNKMILSVIK
jgi:arylsulfatase A-like enzyme/lysophospholipase L1-like esterase